MKLTYLTTTYLNSDQLCALLREIVEQKTGKQLANIAWKDNDVGACTLHFCSEVV